MGFKPWRHLKLLIPGLLVALGLGGCGYAKQSTFVTHGPVAQGQLWLMGFSFWIMVFVGVIVFAALAYAIIRFRDRPGDDRAPAGFASNHKLEIAWTIVPCILLFILAIPTVQQSFFDSAPTAGASAMNVDVVAHQFWWQFNYPGQKLVTANELHIPVGQRVKLTLESADVMHSFWVPQLAGKTDVIPGRHNQMWIEAKKPGVYYGQCAFYCGFGHADMHFLVIAQSPAQYAQWLQTMKAPFVPPTSPLAEKGMKLFGSAGCAACHTIEGTSYTSGVKGPNLTGFALRRGIAAETLPNTAKGLSTWLKNPQAAKPGALMPNLHLNKSQINALVAFLQTLK